MKIISLDKIYEFYCDWFFSIKYGYIDLAFNSVEKYNILSTDEFLTTFIYNMESDDFGDFCDAIKKSGVIIE